jgi:hypothetical protein
LPADDDFKVNPFLSWYLDIDFDLAGRANRTRGFGIVARVGRSFSDNIVDNSAGNKITRYAYFPISLVFNYGIRLANAPIGGKN